MIVHILHMYNTKHLQTLDDILPYVQHSYKTSLHRLTRHSPFQVCLGFQPLYLIYVGMPHVITQTKSTHVLSKADKETKFTKRIQHVKSMTSSTNLIPI